MSRANNRGAFFKSVLGTLNHIRVGDIVCLKSFFENPASKRSLEYVRQISRPASLDTILFDELDDLKTAKTEIDEIIIDWINNLSENDIDAYLYYPNIAGTHQKQKIASLISHSFLHQASSRTSHYDKYLRRFNRGIMVAHSAQKKDHTLKPIRSI